MNPKRVKKIIIILSIIIAIIIAVIVYLIKNGANMPSIVDKNTTNTSNVNNTTNTEMENNISEENIDYNKETSVDGWTEYEKVSQEEIKLQQIDDIYKYFLLKQCLNTYYNPENTIRAMDILDNEVKETLGISASNVANFYENKAGASFCIDKIFEQRVNTDDSSQKLYVVYHRVGVNSSKEDSVVFVKIEERNLCFSIYPYEYLQRYNYLNLQQGDVVKISNTQELKSNDNNGYKISLISKSDWSQTEELYNRYKFDIQFDVDGLYNKIDKSYREARFSNYENFIQYVNNTRQEAVNQELTKYLITKDGKNKEYIALCGDDNYFIFYGKNLMEYTVFLDMYTVPTLRYAENYTASLASVRVRYCIDRIIKAINDKNYEFIYQKLNPVQKRNYYSNYEDFKNFIINNTYDKNDYEVEEKNIMISSNVYQYGVKITDKANEGSKNYKRFVMTVTIEDNMDFTISITK